MSRKPPTKTIKGKPGPNKKTTGNSLNISISFQSNQIYFNFQAETEAQNAANKITDNESEEWKVFLLKNWILIKGKILKKLETKKELTELKGSILKEEELMAFFQQDREKLNYNWIISKKELDDQKSEIINKEREIQDSKENHIMSINLYNQRFVF